MREPRYPLLWFFVLTFVLTAVGQSINAYVMNRLSAGTPAGTPIHESPVFAWLPYSFYVTNIGPSLVGLLMTFWLYGLLGMRRIAIQLSPWYLGRSWPVLVVGLFLPLVIVVLPLAILGTPPDSWSLSTYVYSAVITGGLVGPGICEEIGWRGFALPHLQRRYSALTSSLVIGVAWALWHWPNYFMGSIHQHPMRAFAAAIPIGMAASILYTWVYNSTGGSILSVIVLHGATASTPSWPVDANTSVTWIVPSLYIVIAIGLVCRYGAATLSSRDKVMANGPNTPLHPSGEPAAS